jgi:hypothetical protein
MGHSLADREDAKGSKHHPASLRPNIPVLVTLLQGIKVPQRQRHEQDQHENDPNKN